MTNMKHSAIALAVTACLLTANGWAQQQAGPPARPGAAPEQTLPASGKTLPAPAQPLPAAETTLPAPRPQAAPDGKRAPAQPGKAPARRRSVQATIATMPAAPPVVTEGYRPTLQPRTPAAAMVPAGTAPLTPPPPVQINSCDAGGCTDTGGMRYNGGIGNTTLSPQGRMCTRSGTTMQCF